MTFNNTDIGEVELARHLRLGEVTCHCCGRGGMHVSWLRAWGRLRSDYGQPITVMSGFRCPAHNAEITATYGASRASLHMQGIAGDIAATDPWWFTDEALRVLFNAGFRGIGRDRRRSLLHGDVRAEPYCWTYRGLERSEDEHAMKIWELWRARHDG